jgi:hypothetical protein
MTLDLAHSRITNRQPSSKESTFQNSAQIEGASPGAVTTIHNPMMVNSRYENIPEY